MSTDLGIWTTLPQEITNWLYPLPMPTLWLELDLFIRLQLHHIHLMAPILKRSPDLYPRHHYWHTNSAQFGTCFKTLLKLLFQRSPVTSKYKSSCLLSGPIFLALCIFESDKSFFLKHVSLDYPLSLVHICISNCFAYCKSPPWSVPLLPRSSCFSLPHIGWSHKCSPDYVIVLLKAFDKPLLLWKASTYSSPRHLRPSAGLNLHFQPCAHCFLYPLF